MKRLIMNVGYVRFNNMHSVKSCQTKIKTKILILNLEEEYRWIKTGPLPGLYREQIVVEIQQNHPEKN